MTFTCRQCSRELPAGAYQEGQSLRCPHCGNNAAVQLATPPLPPQPSPPARSRSNATGLWLLIGAAAAGLLLITAVGVASAVLVSRARARPTDLGLTNSTPSNPIPAPVLNIDELEARLAGGTGSDLGNKFAEFMGVKAMGHRFVIIADVSGSMSINNRIARLREEMEKTIKALASDQQFHLIVFHSYAEQMPGGGWLNGGTDVNKVLPWIQGQKPRGGTLPMTAFEMALRLQPRPEVIFFMTDGIIPQDVPNRVKALNEKNQPKVPIHAINFGGEPMPFKGKAGVKMSETTRKRFEEMKQRGEKMLKQLADDSGGSYRFVPDAEAAPPTKKEKGKS